MAGTRRPGAHLVERLAEVPVRRRVWLPAAVALALVIGLGTFVALHFAGGGNSGCQAGDEPVPASRAQGPFLTGRDLDHPHDRRLSRLVAAARSWHLGRVVGGVGYDYGQWLSLAALPGTLGAWTRRDPVFAVLDPRTLRPDWGVLQGAAPHSYDLSGERFFEIARPAHSAPEVSAYSVRDGHRAWCTVLGGRPLRRVDPLSTLPLADGNLLVLAGSDHRLRLSEVGSTVQWSRSVTGVDLGDHLSGPWHGMLLAGGRPQWRLRDGLASGAPSSKPDRRERAVVAALDPATGDPRWRYRVQAGTNVHVLGTTADTAVLLQQSRRGQALVGVGPDGHRRWRTSPERPVLDATLRAGTLVVRDDGGLRGYDGSTGALRWSHPLSASPQQFPYGFTLDQQPMLDAGHLLLGGTRALVSLDLATGRIHRFALPTDGINTTFWPYQVAVTDGLLAVVTNSGAVVLRLLAGG